LWILRTGVLHAQAQQPAAARTEPRFQVLPLLELAFELGDRPLGFSTIQYPRPANMHAHNNCQSPEL